MEREAEAMEAARLDRKANHHERPANLAREAIDNYHKDKEIIAEAIDRRVKQQKEAAEAARTEPPPEFIARVAKKAEQEARHAAFAKGKDAREAMALGKAAFEEAKMKEINELEKSCVGVSVMIDNI